MKKLYLFIFILLSFETFSSANENLSSVDNLFHIDQMNSHNENFALYFKTRETVSYTHLTLPTILLV